LAGIFTILSSEKAPKAFFPKVSTHSIRRGSSLFSGDVFITSCSSGEKTTIPKDPCDLSRRYFLHSLISFWK
jgi:hypothetical protein